MRILAFTNLYPNPLQPHRGTFNRQQLRALAERHEVAVISPIAWTDERASLRSGAKRLPIHRRVVRDGLDVHHPRYWFTPKVLRGWYGHFLRMSVARAFSAAMDEFRPDLIFAAWAYPDGWAAVEIGRSAGLPVVVKVHGSDLLTLPGTPGRGRRTAQAVSRADAVVAVSQHLAIKAVQMGAKAENVSVVYDGINSSLFHPGERDEARRRINISGNDPMILFVGNLVPVKGTDVLVEACSRLVRQSVTFRCCIVGQGPLKETLQKRISQLGLADCVTLVGPVEHERLPEWFRAADVFVLPSRSEGVPCVLLEAAGCQTPFVASRVGGIPEIAHLNQGRMVEPENTAELADAIADILKNPPSRQAISAFSRGHDDAAKELELLFNRVLMRSAKPVPPRASGLAGATGGAA